MSYNYWLFFYDDWLADAASVVPAPGVPDSPLARGGSGHQRLPLDYWEIREQFMRSAPVVPNGVPLIRPAPQTRNAVVRPAPPPPKVLRPYTDEERTPMLAAMRGASSLDELKRLSAKLNRGTY